MFLIYILSYQFSKKLKIPKNIFNLLFIWNTVFTFVYIYYVEIYGGDQLFYYYKFLNLNEFYDSIKELKSPFRPARNFIVIS